LVIIKGLKSAVGERERKKQTPVDEEEVMEGQRKGSQKDGKVYEEDYQTD